jgi:4-amino-4-deoxy-L-arabinose transferase-like glycosyltransferase
MTLAVLATYLLVLQLARPFWALCGMIVFASSPVVMGLATNPNSHATAVCFAAWGMYLLLRWWRGGGVWRGVLAGFLLGSTCTIRYTEGLLVIPLLLVVAFNWRRWKECIGAIAGWATPIALLVSYNLAAMGRITGYDGTNESIGFALQYALDNWDATIRQLGSIALYCIFPFSVVGLAAMLWRNWRAGLVMASWALPCAVVYTFYYWSPDPVNQPPSFISYMRFFLTVMPALVVAAFWLFDQLGEQLEHRRLVQALCGLVTLIAIAVQLQSSTFTAETDQVNRLLLAMNTQQVR